jgi:predicted nucleic acid-binding protein
MLIIADEEINADLLLVEDKEAREYAESRGIHCIGTIGVLELAKEAELIPAIRPFFLEILDKTCIHPKIKCYI